MAQVEPNLVSTEDVALGAITPSFSTTGAVDDSEKGLLGHFGERTKSTGPPCSRTALASVKTQHDRAMIWVLWQVGISCTIAVLVMGLHLGMFTFLHNKPVVDTIPQALQTATANFLSFIVATALLNAIAVSYDQTIWRLFSQRFLKARVIDELIQLPSKPWNIWRLEILKEAPWQWFVAWCCLLLPIACNFPPGALTVVDGMRQHDQIVSTLNVSMTGDGSFTDLRRYTLFSPSVGMNYAGPREDLGAVASAVFTTGEPHEIPGPCNSLSLCKYPLEFRGPYWDCRPAEPATWPMKDDFYQNQSRHFPTIFYAGFNREIAEEEDVLIVPDLLNETVAFQWYPEFDMSNSSNWPTFPPSRELPVGFRPLQRLECSMKTIMYNASIAYERSGRRQISWTKDYATIANAMPIRKNFNEILVDEGVIPSPNATKVKVSDAARRDFTTTQMYAIHEAALKPLLGYAFGGRSFLNSIWYNFFVMGNGTTIGASRLVEVNADDPILKVSITAEMLQEYLFNVTLSTVALNNPSDPHWLTAKPVHFRNMTNVYSFDGLDGKVQFYVPYAISLATTALIALAGIWCVHVNGATAGNNFLQFVATTRISDSLQKHELDSSGGGKENVSETLENTRLRFGIRQPQDKTAGCGPRDQAAGVTYGFGELHEIVPMVQR